MASSKVIVKNFLNNLDTHYRGQQYLEDCFSEKVKIKNCIPFIILHLGCLLVVFAGWSWTAIVVAVSLYIVRMFAITGFYHRYFSHRSFKTSRFFQFIFAVIGNASVQKGPLWWASHHRHHHKSSDGRTDIHSPVQRGFWYSHVGWITVDKNLFTNYERVKDFEKYPEIVFLNRFDWFVPLLLAIILYMAGAYLNYAYPTLNTSGFQLIVWGWFISTTFLFHGTCTINSLSHQYGSQRYQTNDQSRNNFWLSLITLGEGWHNNHHHYPASVRQGFYWWEVDITYYILKVLSVMGVVYDLKTCTSKD